MRIETERLILRLWSARDFEPFAQMSADPEVMQWLGGVLTRERARFERELARARGMELFAVVCETTWERLASGQYRSQMKPHACLQSLRAFQVRYGVPFDLVGSHAAAAYCTYHLLAKFVAEQETRLKAVLANVAA